MAVLLHIKPTDWFYFNAELKNVKQRIVLSQKLALDKLISLALQLLLLVTKQVRTLQSNYSLRQHGTLSFYVYPFRPAGRKGYTQGIRFPLLYVLFVLAERK
jgi:hypothetical protein